MSAVVIVGFIFLVTGVSILASKLRGWANLPGVILLGLGGFALISLIPNRGDTRTLKQTLIIIMLLVVAGAMATIGNKIVTIVSIAVIILVFIVGFTLLPDSAQSAASETTSRGWSGFYDAIRSLIGAI